MFKRVYVRSTWFRIIVPTLLLLTMSATLSYAASVTIPSTVGAVDGDSSINSIFFSNDRTIQVVYPTSELTGLNIGDSIIGIAFRQDTGEVVGPVTDLVYPQYDIKLSQSVNGVGTLVQNPANTNHGPDLTTVHNGSLIITANSYPGGTNPNGFGPEIVFNTPYVYKGGDLLIEFSYISTSPSALILDATSSGELIAGNSYNSTTLLLRGSTNIPVIQLSTVPASVGGVAEYIVVEPRQSSIWSISLIGMGLVSLVIMVGGAWALRRNLGTK